MLPQKVAFKIEYIRARVELRQSQLKIRFGHRRPQLHEQVSRRNVRPVGGSPEVTLEPLSLARSALLIVEALLDDTDEDIHMPSGTEVKDQRMLDPGRRVLQQEAVAGARAHLETRAQAALRVAERVRVHSELDHIPDADHALDVVGDVRITAAQEIERAVMPVVARDQVQPWELNLVHQIRR